MVVCSCLAGNSHVLVSPLANVTGFLCSVVWFFTSIAMGGHGTRWFQAMILFTESELRQWKEMKTPTLASGGGAAANADDDDDAETDRCHLLFMKQLENPMDVSFDRLLKETVCVIAMYGLRKRVSVYSNHCVCLLGFILVHDNCTFESIVEKRSLPSRTTSTSMCFISHTDIIQSQKVGMSPCLRTHIHVSRIGGHILDQAVSRGVHLPERVIASHLRKWAMHAKSILHLWIMLRYVLTGFGGTDIPLLPVICLEQVEMSGIPLYGDCTSPAYCAQTCMNNLISWLCAVERIPSSWQYFEDFVNYIKNDYSNSMNRLEEIERQFSQQDDAWKRYPVIYTERSRKLWSTLSHLSSLSLSTVNTFLREQFIPKHDELFAGTPYDLALEQTSVTVQMVNEFWLYRFGASSDEQVNMHWKAVTNRPLLCMRQLASSLNGPLLCGDPELSAFATFRQPLLMDSSNVIHHVYPFAGKSFDLTVAPSPSSIENLMVGKECLSTLMNGNALLVGGNSCIHEVTNPLLNISTVVVDVDVKAYSSIVSKVRESEANMKQFCSELVENGRKVLHQLESKCSFLEGLADETKHMVFRTEPDNRAHEGFHHLIALPEWVCLQNNTVASAFIELLEVTRPCAPMIGEQGVGFDNIYKSSRHPMRLPFQCKSMGNNPLILVHSDYAETWDVSVNIGSLFIHGQKGPPVQSRAGSRRTALLLIDDISGVNTMTEQDEYYKSAVSVLSQRNILEAQKSSYPSLLERFGCDLNCSSLAEIRALLQRALYRSIGKKLVDRMNKMNVGNTLSVSDISFGWLEDKELMTVGKVNSRYMDVCVAQKHLGLQSCIYYLCVQRQKTGRVYAVLYEMCFSTNCVAHKKNVPYNTQIYAVLG